MAWWLVSCFWDSGISKSCLLLLCLVYWQWTQSNQCISCLQQVEPMQQHCCGSRIGALHLVPAHCLKEQTHPNCCTAAAAVWEEQHIPSTVWRNLAHRQQNQRRSAQHISCRTSTSPPRVKKINTSPWLQDRHLCIALLHPTSHCLQAGSRYLVQRPCVAPVSSPHSIRVGLNSWLYPSQAPPDNPIGAYCFQVLFFFFPKYVWQLFCCNTVILSGTPDM